MSQAKWLERWHLKRAAWKILLNEPLIPRRGYPPPPPVDVEKLRREAELARLLK